MYSYVVVCTRLLLVCTRMLLVCTRTLLICTRMLLVCTRMLLICTCLLLVCSLSHHQIGPQKNFLSRGSAARFRARGYATCACASMRACALE